MLHPVAHHTFRYSYVIVGILLVLLAVVSLSVRVGLPLAASYKSAIESRVSSYLQSPVAIGQLSMRWEGFGPMLRATDVAVLETDERKVTLDELLIDVNFVKSLVRGAPVINELSLVGVNLAVDADANGRLRLHGMERVSRANDPVDQRALQSANASNDGFDIASWLFSARKVGLLDSTITLIDLQADRRLVIDNLNIRAENQGDFHQIRASVDFPEELGGAIELGMDLTGKARQLSATEGSLYIKADDLHVLAISEVLGFGGLLGDSSYVNDHLDANVSVEMWGRWQEGRLRSLRGPIRALSVANAKSGEGVLDSLSGNVSIVADDTTLKIFANDVVAVRRNQTLDIQDLQWVASAKDGSVLSAKASGDAVPLELLSRLPQLMIFPRLQKLDNALQTLAPYGFIRDWSMELSSTADGFAINALADIENVSVSPLAGLPGVEGINGVLKLEKSIGTLSVMASQMPVSWPALTDSSLAVDSIESTINFDLRNLQSVLTNGVMNVVADGIDVNTRFSSRHAPGEPPHLDIQSGFNAKDISAFKQWLPRKLLSPLTSQWIDASIKSGVASNGSLLFFGNVADFPFQAGEGVLNASVNIEQGEMQFLPGWPLATNIEGTIDLNGLSVSANARQSQMGEFDVTTAEVHIGDLASPVLQFLGTANGSLESAIVFGREGPLNYFLEPALFGMSGSGNVEMDIDVTYPLFVKPPAPDTGSPLTAKDSIDVQAVKIAAEKRALTWQPYSVNGSLFLQDNEISDARSGFTLQSVTGAVGFDENGIRLNNLTSNLLGHRLLINGQTKGEGTDAVTRLSFDGALEVNDVLAHQGNTLDQFVSGSSQWNVKLAVPHSLAALERDGVSLNVTSDLVGSQLLLPAPMDKSTAQAIPFSLSTRFKDPDQPQQWQVRYGDDLHVLAKSTNAELDALLVHLGDEKLPRPQLLLEHEGIRLQGHVNRLAMDEWVTILSRYIDSFPETDAEPQPILPVSTALSVDSLLLGGQSLGDTTLRSNSDDTYLNVVVANTAFRGSLRYPRRHWEKQTSLKARVELMDWAVIDALNAADGDDGSISTGELDPRKLPPIEARISRLTRNNITIKDLVIRAQPDVSGLNVSTLGFAYRTMRLVGQGYWHLRDPQSVNKTLQGKHQTQLNLVLQSDDFGVGFNEIGLTDILLDGEGSVALKLNWPGPAYKPQLERMDGSVRLTLENGSIVPLEPGAGRVVGLFALQALPRRLNLDFKDLTADGLAFREISGEATIDNGIANVPLVQLTGPIGVVDITGQSDLVNQRFNQQVTVLPRVSAALPIIGAISGGASAGIGALVAAGFLKAVGVDFDRIGLRSYSLTGDWNNPEFEAIPADIFRQR